MTIHRYLNVYGRSGNQTTWWLIKAMLDAGWTVPMSGSGIGGLYATSNVFDLNHTPKQNSWKDANGVGVGSEPWGHALCWIVLEDPSGRRQIKMQRDNINTDASDDEWFFAYSLDGQYGQGQTPGVDWDEEVDPTAPDGINIWGNGTSWDSLFTNGGTASLVHVAADDTPSPSGVYGVFLIELTEHRTGNAYFILDDVRAVQPGLSDPLAFYIRAEDDCLTIGAIGGTSTVRRGNMLIDPYGPGRAFWDPYATHIRYGATHVWPHQAGRGSDNIERVVPLYWGFEDAHTYVGESRWLLWQANAQHYPATSKNKEHLAFGPGVWIRDLWDGVSVPRCL